MALELSDADVLQATGGRRMHSGLRGVYNAVCTDSRDVTPGGLFVALQGTQFDAHDFVPQALQGGAAGLVVQQGRWRASAGAPCAVYEVQDTMRALGALARLHRQRFAMPLAAVTGSNGKTTVKELAAEIFATRGPVLKTCGNFNNEVGLPLTLFGLTGRHVAAVVELGMNHPGEIARLTDIARPDVGLVTVVQPAHLEGCKSIEGVAKAKGELFHGMSGDGTAVVNIDDARIVAQAAGLASKVFTFGMGDDADVRLASVEQHGREGQLLGIVHEGRTYRISLRLLGDHNALNATAAFALGLALGYAGEACVRGLELAQPSGRRLVVLDAPGGVTILDDCYNANPASMAAALRTLAQLAAPHRAVVVLGDMLELGMEETPAHMRLGAKVAQSAALAAFFGPRMKATHAEAAKRLGLAASHFENLAELHAWLRPQLQSGDVVLVKGSRGMRLERAVEALTAVQPIMERH